MQKDLLPLVTLPKPAVSMDKVEEAVRDWDTSIRLFRKAGGVAPPDDQNRITLIRMMLVDVGAYVSMHWELPEYPTFKKLKEFTFKYIKELRNLRRVTAKPAHLVPEREHEGSEPPASEPGADSEYGSS